MKLDLDALQTRHKIIAFMVLLFFASLFFYFSVLRPQLQRITSLSNELQIEQRRVSAIETFTLNHPNHDEYLIEVRNKLDSANRFLPNEPETSDYLQLINQTAKDTKIYLKSIKPAAYINKNGYREIPVEILIQGDYFQTLSFLEKLESIPRFSTVTNISTQSHNNILESKLSVIIYCYGVKTIPKTAEPALK